MGWIVIVTVCVTKEDLALGVLKLLVNQHASCELIGFNASQVNNTSFELAASPTPYIMFDNSSPTNRLPAYNQIANI